MYYKNIKTQVYIMSKITYCPEIVFCIDNQLLPALILKCVDIILLVENGIKCSCNLSQDSTKHRSISTEQTDPWTE